MSWCFSFLATISNCDKYWSVSPGVPDTRSGGIILLPLKQSNFQLKKILQHIFFAHLFPMVPCLDPPNKCSNVSSLSSTLSVPRSPSETVLFILFWWCLAAVGILLFLLPKVAVLCTSATSPTAFLVKEEDSVFRCDGDSNKLISRGNVKEFLFPTLSIFSSTCSSLIIITTLTVEGLGQYWTGGWHYVWNWR